MNTSDRDGPHDDELLPRLFRALGPVPSLPAEMRRAWETTFSGELARQLAAKRRRRRRLVGSSIGVVVLVALSAYLTRGPAPTADLATADVAHVAGVVGAAESADVHATRTLAVGDQVVAGQTLSTGERTLLALRYRDADVRLNANTIVVLLPTRLQLQHGELYVDSGTAHRGPTVMVETARGMLTHVGTQFRVAVVGDAVRAAVREGAIAFTSDAARRTVSAAQGPRELLVSAGGAAIRPIDGTGVEWGWTVAAAPGFVVDGRSADDFLVWATRQLGARLQYADDAARFHSKTVIMHGNERSLSVIQGLEVIGATAGLELDASDAAVLRVRLRPSGAAF